MHRLDWAKILPRGEDEHFAARQRQRDLLANELIEPFTNPQRRYELGRMIDVLDVGSELAKYEVWRSIDFLQLLPQMDEQGAQMDDDKLIKNYQEVIDQLRPLSPNLTNLYASVAHILDKNPEIASDMNLIVVYEVVFPNLKVSTKKQNDLGPSILEIATQFSPDLFTEAPVVTADASEMIIHDDHMTKEFSDRSYCLTIDMREPDMSVFLGKGSDKPNVLMRLTSETFDDLCDKKLTGFRAFVTGRLQFEGNLGDLKKWQSNVVDRYLSEVDV